MTVHLRRPPEGSCNCRRDAEGPPSNVPRKQVAVLTPDAIEADYRDYLLKRLESARQLLLDGLGEYLTGRRRDFNRRHREAQREDGRRQDGTEREDVEALERTIAGLKVQWGKKWTDEDTREKVDETADQVDAFNEQQNRRVIKSITGLDVDNMGGFKADTSEVLRQFSQRSMELITGPAGIDNQAFQDTREHLVDAVRKGVRHEAFADIVQERLGVAESRARLIARDQIQKLNSQLSAARQKSLGIERYRWSTAGDERVRDSHAAKAGEVFRWDDPPSDTGHPGQDIQCRCSAIPLAEEALQEGTAAEANPEPDIERPAPAPQVSLAETEQAEQEAAAPPVSSDGTIDDLAWPDSLDDLEEEKRLGGSTGARLVTDSDGREFVLKKGNSPGHIESEMAADEAYQELGVPTPRFKQYTDDDGNPVKLAERIEGQTLREFRRNASQAEVDEVVDQIRENFTADAALANWDVIGADQDNIIVAPGGTPWRIDNGGALRYRAQGGLKQNMRGPDEPEKLWNAHPTEVETMRGDLDEKGEDLFADMGADEVYASASRWDQEQVEAAIEAVGTDESILRERLNTLKNFADLNKDMRQDDVYEDYRDVFLRHKLKLRNSEVTTELSDSLTFASGPHSEQHAPKRFKKNPEDEDGIKFDSLRGDGSAADKLEEYIDNKTFDGAHEKLRSWLSAQGGSSNNPKSEYVRLWWGKRVRNIDPDKRYFHNGKNGIGKMAEKFYNRSLKPEAPSSVDAEEAFNEALSIQHAFTHEALTQVDAGYMVGKNRIRLFRSNKQRDLMTPDGGDYDPDLGESGTWMTGIMESSSMVDGVFVYGDTLFRFDDVPAHRIPVMYMQRAGGDGSRRNDTCLYKDSENEALVDLGGLTGEKIAEKSDPRDRWKKAQTGGSDDPAASNF